MSKNFLTLFDDFRRGHFHRPLLQSADSCTRNHILCVDLSCRCWRPCDSGDAHRHELLMSTVFSGCFQESPSTLTSGLLLLLAQRQQRLSLSRGGFRSASLLSGLRVDGRLTEGMLLSGRRYQGHERGLLKLPSIMELSLPFCEGKHK